MGDRLAKDQLFDAFASVAKAVSNGRRAEILDVLAQGPRSVEEIAIEIEQSVANTSHHLRFLARSGLLASTKTGTRVLYRLAGPQVMTLWRTIREVAEQHVAQVDQLARAYLGDRDGLEALPAEELRRRIDRGDVIVLDVRPAAEFEAGHIHGAISIPVTELARRMKELDPDTEVVAYCRGHYCAFADDAVRLLRRRKRKAVRLNDGFPEWKDAGLPVASGEAP